MAQNHGNTFSLAGVAEKTREVLNGQPPELEAGGWQGQILHFLHFWWLVGKSFVTNRAPVRAAALAYTTLIALVPMLAVGASVAISLLQSEGERPIRTMIDKLVAYVAPALDLEIKNAGAGSSGGRELVVAKIADFINNISSGALGVTSMIALVFVAIQMLRTIESTFNDIWGVTRGRGWLPSIVQYWAFITLGPLVLIGALAITSGPHFAKTQEFISAFPVTSAVVFSVVPFFLLSLGFCLFYIFMPNTRVQVSSALVGGVVAGFLWQVNSMLIPLYASRVVTYSKIYGSLGLVPLFLVSLYLAWLFLLFGSQVAYAHQNRQAYLQHMIAENVSQQGREFAALRLMTFVAQRFMRGEPPATPTLMSRQLGIPTRLAGQVLSLLAKEGLVVEGVGREPVFIPGRPLSQITCADILRALRNGSGRALETSADGAREKVSAELRRINDAEAAVAGGITLEALAKEA